MTQTFVSVGASQTAAVWARTLRRRGFDGSIVLIGDEPQPPYQRPPLSKEYLQGEQDLDEMFLLAPEWCEKNNVTLRLATRVERIRPRDRALDLADGCSVTADAVLLATGGRPRILGGLTGDRILYLRTLEDADRLRVHLAPGRHVITVGGGFIGSEIAAAARAAGADVTVLEAMDVPLEMILGRDIGRVCGEIHRSHGVDLQTSRTVETIESGADSVTVRTRDGGSVEGDVVVVGIGTLPNVEVAAGTDIQVSNGIVVDEYCQTSLDGIFAAGDVANHYHPVFDTRMRVEHFDNANKQGMAAAKNMVGQRTVFNDPHWFWSDQYELNLQHVGHATQWDDVVVRGSLDEFDFTAFYLSKGVLRAAFAVERGDDIGVARQLISVQASPDPAKLRDEDVDLFDLMDDEE